MLWAHWSGAILSMPTLKRMHPVEITSHDESADVAANQSRAPSQEGGVQSLTRAFALLEAIAESHDGIGLKDLARKVDLHSSTAFHLLKTMTRAGYVKHIDDSKRYIISTGIFCLAVAARNEVHRVSIANPILRELALKSASTALFGVPYGHSMAVVAKAEGNEVFQISDGVGTIRPCHCTAMGKIMLASMPQQILQEFLGQQELLQHTPNTIVDRFRLLSEVEEVRRNHIAFDDAEFREELRCAAAPVRDFTGQLVGALAMSGPVWRLSLQALQKNAAMLRELSGRLSSELGHRSKPDVQLSSR